MTNAGGSDAAKQGAPKKAAGEHDKPAKTIPYVPEVRWCIHAQGSGRVVTL